MANIRTELLEVLTGVQQRGTALEEPGGYPHSLAYLKGQTGAVKISGQMSATVCILEASSMDPQFKYSSLSISLTLNIIILTLLS